MSTANIFNVNMIIYLHVSREIKKLFGVSTLHFFLYRLNKYVLGTKYKLFPRSLLKHASIQEN